MSSAVPEPRETLDLVMPDGAHILARVHGNPAGPRLVLAHGNGFAIDAYVPFWGRLLDGYEVVVHDLRNHGRNPLFGSPGHNIEGFARDHATLLRAIPERLGAKPTAGLYHSVSAIAALTHATSLEEGAPLPWAALVLFDPPIIPSPGHQLHAMAQGMELFLANWAMSRPDRFADPAELAAQFSSAKGLSRWIAGAHEGMARAVLRAEGDGWVLSCPRALEAATYVGNAYSRLWEALPRLQAHRDRVLLVCSDPDIEDARSPSFTGRAAAETFGIQRTAIPNTTHLLQIEAPEPCAKAATAFLSERGLAPAA
ncbi:MAG: alpha/beta hydrolase [Alphaproteobacteria bacterium]|nr:alpha/beta hydrolase [Alphaproteobacteria bacterium]